jgi:hypothetical protein
MQRIVIFVAVLYVLWRLATALGRRSASAGKGAEDFSRFNARSRDRRRAAKERQSTNVELVACHRCGTFVPADRALPGGDDSVYCSRQCQGAFESGADEKVS